MTPDPSSDKDLQIADLRRRLAEAEETVRAIRENEVDALVMRGHVDDEIFTIGGDHDSYRAFMEVMEPGAAALDGCGRVLYANSTLTRLLDISLAQLQGKLLVDAFTADTGKDIGRLLKQAHTTRQSCEIQLPRGEEVDLHFIAMASPLQIGTSRGHAVTFANVTERVLNEGAEQSEHAARAVIASANEAVLVCDRDGVVTHANAAASIVYDGNPIGKIFAEIIPLLFRDSTGLLQADDIIEMVIAGTPLRGIEAIASNAPKVKDYLVSAAPLRVAGDRISGAVVTMVDLSQRKAAEKQQILLMRELDHRVKNTLTLVASISNRTASNSDTVEAFQKAFSGRIQALAATHTLLLGNSWSSLKLGDIVMTELAPYIESTKEQVTVEGLNIAVTPHGAIAFGLIVHELTTNAVKYGALSQEGGHVTVRAVGRDSEKNGAFVLEWRESGGPRVTRPERKGFGHTVVERSLQYSGGGAEFDFDPAGVICRIAIPSEELS
ncbi:HWE histidine kinase domain-containing protein [Nitrobacter sp. NHB1]|uniref:sensor histidine kinase n=1 Tax=Nitrobacter sp. NHB1 TaxID=3119830 RepID=UPI0030009EEC